MSARRMAGVIAAISISIAIATSGCGGDDDGDAARLCDALDASRLGSLVVIEAPAAAQAVGEAFTLSGCAATFEQNVRYRVTARDGTVLADGFTTGNAPDVGVVGDFSTEVTLDPAPEPGLLTLEVFEEDVAEGEGGVPPRHVVPLVAG